MKFDVRQKIYDNDHLPILSQNGIPHTSGSILENIITQGSGGQGGVNEDKKLFDLAKRINYHVKLDDDKDFEFRTEQMEELKKMLEGCKLSLSIKIPVLDMIDKALKTDREIGNNMGKKEKDALNKKRQSAVEKELAKDG